MFIVRMTRRDGAEVDFGPFTKRDTAETFIIRHRYGPEYLNGYSKPLTHPKDA